MYYKTKLWRLYIKYFNGLHLVTILLLSVIVFRQIYSLSFLIGWDDQTYVTNHYTEDGLFSQNIYAILTEFYHGQYAPVNQLYYSTLFEFFDYNTSVYHIGSLIVHLANTILVYFLICKIAKQLFTLPAIKSAQIAAITALLFGVAPINLEAVAWVSASKVLWYAFFYFLSLVCYVKYIDEQKPGYYYASLLLFILSFGSKEQAVTLPVVMLSIDYIFRRDLRKAQVWYEKLPLVALTMTFALASFQSQGGGKLVIAKYYSIGERLLLSLYTITEYFTKTVFPVNLSFAYPYPFQVGQQPPLWIWVYPVTIPAIIYCLWCIIKQPWVMWGALFFLVHVLVVSNAVNLSRFSGFADRYTYVASVGLYFLLAVFFTTRVKKTNKHPFVLGSGLTYLLFFCMYTSVHLQVWKNAITLKEKMRDVIHNRADYESWENKNLRNNDEK